MPLVISLRQGHGFHAGSSYVEVAKVRSAYSFSVRADNQLVLAVEQDEWTQVLPGVRVQAGVPQHQEGKVVRVIIDAPGMKIIRSGAKDPVQLIARACEVCNGTKMLSTQTTCAVCQGHGCSACNHGKITVGFKCPECNTGE